MSRSQPRGLFSNKIRVFILLWVFLQNAVVSFGGNLLSIYFSRPQEKIDENPFYWSPNYWFGGGGVIGGILVLILSHTLDIKSIFSAIRCIQIIAMGVVFAMYKVQDNEWAQDYWIPGVCSTFFLQGTAESMSQILTPVYLMSTLCDRDLDEPAAFLLLVNTQLPLHLAAFFANLLSIHPLFLTVGVGVFGGTFFLVLVFSIFLPRARDDGKENDKSEYLEYWHLQFESEYGWLRPALTVTALYLLSQLSGLHIYLFYSSWSLGLAQVPIQPNLVTAAIFFFALLFAVVAWTKEKLSYFLVISTGVQAVCSFLSGILLHGLEAGVGVAPYAPGMLFLVFTVAHSVGLGPLPGVVGALITPRTARLGVFTVAVLLTSAAASLARAAVPVLIQLLHPFGVFWFHSGILLLGLLFISLVVIGQIRERAYPSSASPTAVDEFITQV